MKDYPYCVNITLESQNRANLRYYINDAYGVPADARNGHYHVLVFKNTR
jgi:hypothetical protein